ncbi:MAG: YczE/YyaS/YitT family protein [Candidatus Pelagibacter sp.]|tara:strand:- start:2250 stop:2897 length:648 start_codon:yes stop_codon:yes gene_type:complete
MFLTIKKIPKNTWSSKKPLNFKPKFLTSFFLCLGLVFFGLGEGLLIVSTTGNSPWSVLAEGISINLKVSIGIVTFFISVFVLILWFFLNQKPGIGTLLNIIIIAIMIDVSIFFFNPPSDILFKYFLAILSVLLVGLGSGFYLIANLGPGPRDGLMTGIQRKTNFPIALVRAILEISVVGIGWYLGGTVGIGTLMFAFGIGPAVALGLYLVNRHFY